MLATPSVYCKHKIHLYWDAKLHKSLGVFKLSKANIKCIKVECVTCGTHTYITTVPQFPRVIC